MSAALSRNTRVTVGRQYQYPGHGTDSGVQILNTEGNEVSARAAYLLATLKSRRITWPELRWQPEVDGGVCSFLGTVNGAFDADATLAVLEAREAEERLRANAAEI